MSQDQAELPMFPFARTVGDLESPPGGRPGVPVSRVRLPTGRTAWLATRHADVRQMLRSGAFSSDMTKPGFPLMVNADASAPMPGFFLAMEPPRAHQVPAAAHPGIHAQAHAAARTAHLGDRDQRARCHAR